MRIIILGGGIVGLTAAALLAQNEQIKIILIEANQPTLQWDNTKYDLRCSAISRSSQQVFRHIGVWDKICTQRVGMYNQMHLWSSDVTDKFIFDAAQIKQPDLGHIIENRIMLKALWDYISSKNNIIIKFGSAEQIKQQASKNYLNINDEQIDAELIIGADGADSWLRRAVNIQVQCHSDQQQALVATVLSKDPHANIARQRFTANGPLAFLPLDQECLSSIVWSGSKEQIAEIISLDDSEFCKRLQNEFSNELGKLNLYGARASFPLRMQHAETYIADRVALIGDAAHVVHPLAGQGLNMGLMDAATLAEVVINAAILRQDIGARTVLRKYERWRKGPNLGMLTIINAFNMQYANNVQLFGVLRDTGLQVVNKLPVIKANMMHYAMGISNDLPKCAKSPIFVGVS